VIENLFPFFGFLPQLDELAKRSCQAMQIQESASWFNSGKSHMGRADQLRLEGGQFPMPPVYDESTPGGIGFMVNPQYSDKLLPVLMFTSPEHPADMAKARELGATDYIVKPSAPIKLIELAQSLHDRWLSPRVPAQPDGGITARPDLFPFLRRPPGDQIFNL
jgi:hypothetical protein